MTERNRECVKEAYKRIKQKYFDVELGESSFQGGEIWIHLIVPENLLDNEEFEDYRAKIGTDMVLEYKKLIFFKPMLKENHLVH